VIVFDFRGLTFLVHCVKIIGTEYVSKILICSDKEIFREEVKTVRISQNRKTLVNVPEDVDEVKAVFREVIAARPDSLSRLRFYLIGLKGGEQVYKLAFTMGFEEVGELERLLNEYYPVHGHGHDDDA